MKLNFFEWLIVIDVADDVMGAQVNDSTPSTFYIYGFSFYNFGFCLLLSSKWILFLSNALVECVTITIDRIKCICNQFQKALPVEIDDFHHGIFLCLQLNQLHLELHQRLLKNLSKRRVNMF